MTTYARQRDREIFESFFGNVGEEEFDQWAQLADFAHNYPDFLPWLQVNAPERYEQLAAGFKLLAVDATDKAWRGPNGGRPAQLLPGTEGAQSQRTDWRYWLLLGGRGSGKSLSGAHGIRELLFATPWTGNVRVGFVGRTLDDCRSEMFIETFMQLVPPGSILNWKAQDVILSLALPNGHVATISGYSAETPKKVRGPNLHLAWADEIAAYQDSDRGTAAVGTTWSNLNYAVRVKAVDRDGNLWRPRIIATTTPMPVRILHNLDPADGTDPGLGLHQDPKTVVSSMSTLENLENLGEDFYESAIEPYEGTRLYEQEVLGRLMMEAVGALWSSELIEAMGRHPTYPLTQGGGFVETVVGVDPAISEGKGTAEHGIVVAGRAADGCCYIVHDASMKGRPSELCDKVAALAKQWNCSRAVVEVNNGGSWLSETMGRSYPWLRVEYVWAKKSKRLRAEPAALLSDKGRLFLAGSFPKLSHQMRTYTGDGPSPDRLDAMVYAVMFLMPNEARIGQMVRVVSKRLTRR